MKIISSFINLFRGSSTPAPHDDYWYGPIANTSVTGEVINSETALRVSAVMACVKVLAETVASAPLIIYKRLPNGGKERAPNHPLYNLLHNQPNEYQTAFEFYEMMQAFLALRGNAYAEIISNNRQFVTALNPIHPDRVTVTKANTGRIVYEITEQGSAVKRQIAFDRMVHIKGLSLNGYTGLSPIEYAAESVGLSIAAEKYGGRFFKNDARPGGVLEHPSTVGDKAYKHIKESWAASHTGNNQHTHAILEEGMKWNQTGITNDEAQFLETRKFQAGDIARIYRVQPHMIGVLDDATFSNIAEQSLEFVKYTMLPWFKRWEQAITSSLILAPQTYFAEFLLTALLRGDQKGRYESYASAIGTGWMSRNEVRVLENMNPKEGLDEYIVPLNMGNAGGQFNEPKDMTAIIDTTAERLANAEIRTLSRRVDKASEDRDRFNSWVGDYFEKHTWAYAASIIDPLFTSKADSTDVLDSIFDTGLEFAKEDVEPVELLEQWRKNRKTELFGIILKGLAYEVS